MNLDTLVKNYLPRAIIRLQDDYSSAKCFGLTHDQLLTRLKEGRDAYHFDKWPRWAQSEWKGYQRCLADRLYETSLVYGGMVDGRFYSTHSNRDDYYQKHGIQPSAYADNGKVTARGHYWDIRGTIKPFFMSAE